MCSSDLDRVVSDAPPQPPTPLAAATADTITRVPLPIAVAATAPQRRGAPGWIDHEASDAETSPFEHEATSTDLGVPWLDDAAGPAIGTLDVTDLIDATIDLPED